jgi:hypothetical protein
MFNESLKMSDYMHATGNSQSWAMFAPNPHRSNTFMRVYVVDDQGETWDLAHDAYKRRKYPYVFYDRLGKINRRIIDQKGYRRHYAAWVCREWERTHEGKPAREVKYAKLWTKIPPPHVVIKAAGWNLGAMWFDPDLLPLNQTQEETFNCRSTQQAQLPKQLRDKYGFPEAEHSFRALRLKTWWDDNEREAKAAERAAETAKAEPVEGAEVDQ